MFQRIRKLFSGRRQGATAATPSKAAPEKKASYHAVSIRAAEGCCESVKAMTSVRFLSNEAPLLPLKDCTAASCDCRYVRYPDRRHETRRFDDTSVSQRITKVDDRRSADVGRRKDDHIFD